MDSTQASNAQQFCLRWHNHQASLLSSLPLLLDQSHLTDVTLSAEGRTVRAHRVVLSACSTFFSELFRTLEPPYHPVVVLPGASFAALVALLTFMYSGEVNVFEEQISSLLSLAETLGIKGLADFNGNISKTSPKRDCGSSSKDSDVPSSVSSKVSSPLENLFTKPFSFYPHLMPQPLNFSQNRSSDLFSKYQCHGKFHLGGGINLDDKSSPHHPLHHLQQHHDENNRDEDNNNNRKNYSDNRKNKSDMKRIDKIAENLRSATNKNYLEQQQKIPIIPQSPPSSLVLKPPPPHPHALPSAHHHHFMPDETMPKTPESLLLDSSQPTTPTTLVPNDPMSTESLLEKSIATAITKPGNSKLYATCFICHKQLSNQYNLRVHLETHQNVRYACTVCSHVSRSKDALRKHVSYRHPGAPSPCESETRRKRAKMMGTPIKQEIIEAQNLMQQQQQQQQQHQGSTQSLPNQTTPIPSTNSADNVVKKETKADSGIV